jgi:hypothetical protein
VNKHMYSADALEETAVFKAYNQAIDDAKSAIRGERVDDPSAAPTFINAIARKCSPHRYAAQIAVAMKSGTDLAYADGYANGFRHGNAIKTAGRLSARDVSALCGKWF